MKITLILLIFTFGAFEVHGFIFDWTQWLQWCDGYKENPQGTTSSCEAVCKEIFFPKGIALGSFCSPSFFLGDETITCKCKLSETRVGEMNIRQPCGDCFGYCRDRGSWLGLCQPRRDDIFAPDHCFCFRGA